MEFKIEYDMKIKTITYLFGKSLKKLKKLQEKFKFHYIIFRTIFQAKTKFLNCMAKKRDASPLLSIDYYIHSTKIHLILLSKENFYRNLLRSFKPIHLSGFKENKVFAMLNNKRITFATSSTTAYYYVIKFMS